eukprot:TRINITY_DN5787_c0_g1_i2.p1 TRINITY_DN5787_c0_g1~~TRINITY_DN5787_c0_g1_i2.p1  ORF type:complete len:117 (+),score=26.61 TRINITY_DN5787_c0_g1_i2:171-521(+)
MEQQRLMDEGQDGTPEVSYEDQQRINQFGKLNQKHSELGEQISKLGKTVRDNEDAETELMMVMDDDKVDYHIGDCFFSIPGEDATDRLGEETSAATVKKEVGFLFRVYYLISLVSP